MQFSNYVCDNICRTKRWGRDRGWSWNDGRSYDYKMQISEALMQYAFEICIILCVQYTFEICHFTIYKCFKYSCITQITILILISVLYFYELFIFPLCLLYSFCHRAPRSLVLWGQGKDFTKYSILSSHPATLLIITSPASWNQHTPVEWTNGGNTSLIFSLSQNEYSLPFFTDNRPEAYSRLHNSLLAKA